MTQSTNDFSTTANVLHACQAQGTETPIHYEFQYFGNYLAEQLNYQPHTTLYMKLAKEIDRALLEKTLDFVRGSARVKNKARLFMW